MEYKRDEFPHTSGYNCIKFWQTCLFYKKLKSISKTDLKLIRQF